MTVRTEPVQWIAPHVPDADTLAAIGEVVVRHVHLDHMLKMTIKSLTGISVNDALANLARKGSPHLRQEIEREAERRLGEGEALRRLRDLIDRCRTATDRRDFYAKTVYAIHLSEPHVGEQAVLDADLRWHPVPSVDDLRQLVADIETLLEEVNDARLHGWLKDALEA